MRVTVVGAVVIVAAVIGAVLLIRQLNKQNQPKAALELGQSPA